MKKLMILSGLLVSNLSLAAQSDFTVQGVGISDFSKTIFLDVNESHSKSSCSDKNSFRFKTEHPLYKEVYATLLTAKTTKRTVTIAFTEKAEDCVYSSPQINLSVYKVVRCNGPLRAAVMSGNQKEVECF